MLLWRKVLGVGFFVLLLVALMLASCISIVPKKYTFSEDIAGAAVEYEKEFIISTRWTPVEVLSVHYPLVPTSNETVFIEAQASSSSGKIAKVSIYMDDALASTCNAFTCNHTAGPFKPGTSHSYYAIASDDNSNNGRDPKTGTYTFFVSDSKVGKKGVLFVRLRESNELAKLLLPGVKIEVQNEAGAVISTKFSGDTPTIFTLDYGKYTLVMTANGYMGKMVQLDIDKESQQLTTSLTAS